MDLVWNQQSPYFSQNQFLCPQPLLKSSQSFFAKLADLVALQKQEGNKITNLNNKHLIEW